MKEIVGQGLLLEWETNARLRSDREENEVAGGKLKGNVCPDSANVAQALRKASHLQQYVSEWKVLKQTEEQASLLVTDSDIETVT